jgi:multimeric flavodoxin WrbA
MMLGIMKTLLLNGSARAAGHTARLVNTLLEGARGDIVGVNAFKDRISPCLNCGQCKPDSRCILNDKMRDVYDAIETVDNVIIASPVYFGGLTPPLLSVLSRLQCYFKDYTTVPAAAKRKKGVILLTGGGSGVTGRAEADARLMLKIMNAEIVDVVFSVRTDKLAAAADTAALKRVAEAAKILFSK